MSEPVQHRRGGWPKKFGCAFRGLVLALRSDRSFWVHVPAALTVVLLASLLRLTAMEWAVLVLCIGLVLASELLNTGLENLAKHVSREESPQVGQALDIAAGGVLTASICAAVGGLMILGPHGWRWIAGP